jgi:hypothetical protein
LAKRAKERRPRYCVAVEGGNPLSGGKRCYFKEAKREKRVEWTKLALEALGLPNKISTSTE